MKSNKKEQTLKLYVFKKEKSQKSIYNVRFWGKNVILFCFCLLASIFTRTLQITLTHFAGAFWQEKVPIVRRFSWTTYLLSLVLYLFFRLLYNLSYLPLLLWIHSVSFSHLVVLTASCVLLPLTNTVESTSTFVMRSSKMSLKSKNIKFYFLAFAICILFKL